MRDILIHKYFATDNNIVWLVVEKDIPVLKAVVNAIILEERKS